MRGFRHLVENNFGGLKVLLDQYSSMPWRVEVAFEEELDRGAFGPRVQSVRHFHSAIDEVVHVSKVSKEGVRWSSSGNMFAYRGVRDAAYELVAQDLKDLMSGSNPLGSIVL